MGHLWKAAHFHGKSGFFLHLTQGWTKAWIQAWLFFYLQNLGELLHATGSPASH